MKTLKVTLKQHTPLIHFQHDQYGATLRASEVKPKLDKFIIEKLGGGDYENVKNQVKNTYPQLFIPKEGVFALDYKLKIKAFGNRNEYLISSYIKKEGKETLDKYKILYIANSPYFAQENENKAVIKNRDEWDKIPRKGILYDGAELVFLAKDEVADRSGKNIIVVIYEYIQSFFVITNFGTRQDKGFGSFTVSNNGDSGIDSILKKEFSFCYKSKKKYDIGEESKPDFNLLFSKISAVYRKIRSGSSFKKYEKSSLMEYYDEEKIRWEKKYFKQQIEGRFKNDEGEIYRLKDFHKKTKYNNQGTPKFVRAVLGIPGQYEFILENPPLGDSKNKLIVSVDGGEEIKRYKSPLTFKVISGYIYILGDTVHPEILNRDFKFYVNIDKDENNKDESIGILRTPSTFNLVHFMEYAMRTQNEYIKLK